jgi:HK97 family phage prohead protease
MSEIDAGAKEKRGTSPLDTRLAAFNYDSPASIDVDARTIDVVMSAGAQVRRSSWRDGDYIEELAMKPGNIRTDRLNSGAAMLDSHDYWSGTRAILGAVVPGSVKVAGGELRGKVKFSRSEEGERAFQDAKDGILRFVSVGYITHKFEVDEETSPPTRRATDWEPYEVSVVAMPADPNAGFRSAIAPRPTAPREETSAAASAACRARARMTMRARSI